MGQGWARGEAPAAVMAAMASAPVGEPWSSARITAALGRPISTGTLSGALAALVRSGDVVKVSHGHYAKAPRRRTRPAGRPATAPGDGELWELLAVASDGAVLLRSTDGRVWRAVEV